LLVLRIKEFGAAKSGDIGLLNRERIPVGGRNYSQTPSLPEKAEGFTMRSVAGY